MTGDGGADGSADGCPQIRRGARCGVLGGQCARQKGVALPLALQVAVAEERVVKAEAGGEGAGLALGA